MMPAFFTLSMESYHVSSSIPVQKKDIYVGCGLVTRAAF